VSEMVALKLAHPLTADRAATLRAAEVRDYAVGEEIVVPSDEARAVIGAGYALGVEPSDPGAVARALEGRPARTRAAASPGPAAAK
jgi:hypothetical protein